MVTILAYHGVTDVESEGIENFQRKHLKADVFAEQISYLHSHERVVRLEEVIDAYEAGKELDGVVVTFDDGYRNNLTVALPILERFGVPATFFLTTGFIGVDRMFWVDEVEFLVNQSSRETVDLTDIGLREYPLATLENKTQAVTEIKRHLKQVADEIREDALARLKTLLPSPPNGAASRNYHTLTWDEAQALSRASLADIGAHSVDHAILTRLKGDQLLYQIRESKRALERHLGCAITHFAYPNGGVGDYNEDVIRAVRNEGFRSACTTLPGRNSVSVSSFELRRTMVGFCGEPFPFPVEARA